LDELEEMGECAEWAELEELEELEEWKEPGEIVSACVRMRAYVCVCVRACAGFCGNGLGKRK
jgi:hypothetical protein